MLVDKLKSLLGSVMVLHTKCQNFHWNIEGKDFPQYHDFFGDMGDEIYTSVDRIAEYIRTLDSYSPGALARMIELSVIDEQQNIPKVSKMMQELFDSNLQLINLLNVCMDDANHEKKHGIANFIAERLDAHEKHGWKLRSIIKAGRE